MIKDIKEITACPDCASGNIVHNMRRDQVICKDCGLIYEPLTTTEESVFELTHNLAAKEEVSTISMVSTAKPKKKAKKKAKKAVKKAKKKTVKKKTVKKVKKKAAKKAKKKAAKRRRR